MYLQITEKCNMTCEHCGLSCTMKGKHGNIATIRKAISWILDYGNEYITIGGGEPTLHPNFFEILKICLEEFEYVWFATNGSQTDTMLRLHNIMMDENYPECDSDDRLSVDLSQDPYHSPIDPRIIQIWSDHYTIRDTSLNEDGLINAGRAKENNIGGYEECICSGLFIQPSGHIKLCGCSDSPIIGDVYSGISEEWEDTIYDDEGYRMTECHKSISEKEIAA